MSDDRSDIPCPVPAPSASEGVPALFAELRRIYDRVESDAAALRGTCERSGRCCRFREFGHRLYLTEPERRLMLAGGLPDRSVVDAALAEGRCPFLTTAEDGRPACGNRERRALGCRLFFCNLAESDPAMTALYERAHAEITALGARHGIAYRYRDWPACAVEET